MERIVRRLAVAAAALLMVAGTAGPAAAQFSESYNFLKAVKDKDGAKATEILDKPGNTVVNTRDNDTGDTALHIATRRSDASWVGFLLQKGASANSRDRDGNTPVMVAAQTRWAEGVQIYVAIKSQLDLQNRIGETALQKAVQNRDTGIAKMLIDGGANPDITDSSGRSARSMAESDPRAAPIAKMFAQVPVRKARQTQGPSL